MASIQVRIRDGVYRAIAEARAADPPRLVITDFDVEQTYYPHEDLETLGEKPFVKVVAMNFGNTRERILRVSSRKDTDPTEISPSVLEVPVQVAIQQRIPPTQTNTIDRLVEFSEQIMGLCEDDELVETETSEQNYQWQRTEPLRDENGLVLSYEELKVKGIFNSIFTAYYQYVNQ